MKVPEAVQNAAQLTSSNSSPEAAKKVRTGIATGRKSKEQKRLEAEARNRLSKERKRLRELVGAPDSSEWLSVPDELKPEAMTMLESRIESLESERSQIEEKLADPDFYSDGDRSRRAVARFEQLQAAIGIATDRWEMLATLDEAQ